MIEDMPKDVILFMVRERLQTLSDLEGYKSKDSAQSDGVMSFGRGYLHALSSVAECRDRSDLVELARRQVAAVHKANLMYQDTDALDSDDPLRRRRWLTWLWHFGASVGLERVLTCLHSCEGNKNV